MIDEETRRVIEEFMDEMGVPSTDYEKAFQLMLNEAVSFSLIGSRKIFRSQLDKKHFGLLYQIPKDFFFS